MIVVAQNDPHVPPGLLEEALQREGASYEVWKAYSENRVFPIESVEALVVLGGKMSVKETSAYPFLDDVRKFILEALQRNIPYLGICLGGQMLAEVSGGAVHRHTCGEKGFHTISLTEDGGADPVFRRLPAEFTSFEWHEDSFIPPEGAVHLAGTEHCRFQAFRLGRCAYGLQFHPEVNARIVAGWSGEKTGPGRFLSEYLHREREFRSVSLSLLQGFLQLALSGRDSRCAFP